ncbi:MAG: hypothetical protein R6V12_19865 [Candidatus Hydrogenedentota bacterium]
MTTTTWNGPFYATQPVYSGAVFKGLLSCLLDDKTRPPGADIMGSSMSEGLNDDDVARKRAIANGWSRLLPDTVGIEGASATDFSEASPERVMTERKMMELLESFGGELSDQFVDEPEMIDWDEASSPRTQEIQSLSVSLHYAGRGKPLADDDPWT